MRHCLLAGVLLSRLLHTTYTSTLGSPTLPHLQLLSTPPPQPTPLPPHIAATLPSEYAEGCKLSTQQPHRDAAEPACQHFGSCGGCSLQALTYPAQLAHKSDHVSQLLARVGRLDAAAVAAAQQPAIAAAAVYGYRNKVQLAFSSLVWEAGQGQEQLQQQQEAPGGVRQGFGLGYFLPGSSSVVLPIQECSLAVSG